MKLILSLIISIVFLNLLGQTKHDYHDRCWEIKNINYSIVDKTTRFILDSLGKTIQPYIIRRYYHNNEFIKEIKLNPLNQDSI